MNGSESLLIRRGERDDAARLTAIAARTFRETFENDNTPEDMQAYLAKSFSPQQVAADLEDPATIFLLAFVAAGIEPAGYAKLRPGPMVGGTAAMEIERLYVGREALGRGIGAALMQACLDEAADAGHQTVWLGVWERNHRARAFYGRWGFEEVGEHVFVLGSDPQRDVIMKRPVELDKEGVSSDE